MHPPLQSLLLPLHLHQRLLLWWLILHTPLGINRISLFFSTLISTLSDSVLPYAVGIKTSRDAWLTLERMLQIRYQLATLKKGALAVTDYFQKAQTLAHTLAAIEEPLKESELISYVLCWVAQGVWLSSNFNYYPHQSCFYE